MKNLKNQNKMERKRLATLLLGAGGLVALAWLVWRRNWKERKGKEKNKEQVSFNETEREEIEMQFKRAVEHVNQKAKNLQLDQNLSLEIYSLFKQATFGDNNKAKPTFSMIESAKWSSKVFFF